MKRIFLLSFFLCPLLLSAQPKYWIYLKDKDKSSAPAISKTTIENRQRMGIVTIDETDFAREGRLSGSAKPACSKNRE